MTDIAIARGLHVLAVVHWIGGVFMATAVILPAIARLAEPERRVALFEAVERRFSSQAKLSVTLAGLTGFYITHRYDAWGRFLDPGYWWMHAMTLVWALFAFVLFVAEPLFLHAWFRRRAAAAPESTFMLIQRFHFCLLIVSLVTIGAAVLGAHGILF
ncbi:hypothetical protein [Amphiplicatus metriothermophilus]|uniref:Uncharacterized membrane protein n=1 Tax=Amphiplicatus metriothermophilus TaxID=1519374 RepID=A0A239PQ09_9PROT|nr:hypothetical protein [Amphiplicatus metriothermophilus]MBB5518459.1 putative membrane protein [Amphiplicatus metriothermophilus]SNT72379.1 Uncharacterized membrane protein [Amphiplicatus metriothermophilus]